MTDVAINDLVDCLVSCDSALNGYRSRSVYHACVLRHVKGAMSARLVDVHWTTALLSRLRDDVVCQAHYIVLCLSATLRLHVSQTHPSTPELQLTALCVVLDCLVLEG